MSRVFNLPLALLGLPALLAACATPQEQCISAATQQLRSLERAIAVTEGNIARGYAIHTQQISRTVRDVCYATDEDTGKPVPYPCLDTEFDTIETPVQIDVAQERIKLDEYRRALPQYETRARAAVAQCQAQFPEDGA